MVGLVAVTVFAVGGVFGVPAAVSSPDYPVNQPNQPHQYVDVHLLALAAASDTAGSTTTTDRSSVHNDHHRTRSHAHAHACRSGLDAGRLDRTHPGPPPAASPPAPAVPAIGQATAWGCSAALAYLQTYAAPGFTLDCPGYAEGHEAMTCLYDTPAYPDACPNGPTIAISDPCPQAYMNESANSWNLTGQLSTEQQKFGVSYADIDPFGPCP